MNIRDGQHAGIGPQWISVDDEAAVARRVDWNVFTAEPASAPQPLAVKPSVWRRLWAFLNTDIRILWRRYHGS